MKTIIAVLFLISAAAIAILYLELTGSISMLKSRTDSFALTTGLFIPFTLLFLGYTELRKFKTYIVWFLLGTVMLAFYFYFKDAPSIQMKRGSALKSFKSLIVFLIAFQLSRFAFRKLTGGSISLLLVEVGVILLKTGILNLPILLCSHFYFFPYSWLRKSKNSKLLKTRTQLERNIAPMGIGSILSTKRKSSIQSSFHILVIQNEMQ